MSISNRPLEARDLSEIPNADFYTGRNRESFVYEDSQGVAGVLRYTKTLRICGDFSESANEDLTRKSRLVKKAIADSIERAKAAGFTEIIFEIDSPTMAKFCEALGFEKSAEYKLAVSPVTAVTPAAKEETNV
jgi:hypothetical protein